MSQKHIYACIMAGGVGERFWPESRRHLPKQFLNIVGDTTLIQATIERITPVISRDHILVVSNQNQAPLIEKQLPFLKKDQVLLEPRGRNTAPCIGLAAAALMKKDPKSVMVVLPSDHVIKNPTPFLRVIHDAAEVAKQTGDLVTLGIQPTGPETGYGYIHWGESRPLGGKTKFYAVKNFVEKPSQAKAQDFLKDGHYLWNSGMFIWSAKAILEAIEHHLPELFKELKNVESHLGQQTQADAILKMYEKVESVSIDYGVMEKAKNILVALGDFEWDDVGAWPSVERHFKKDGQENIFVGNHVDLGSESTIVMNRHEGMVATLGLKNVVIVRTGDAVLIMDKARAQEVKGLLELMKNHSEHQKYL